MSPSSKEIRAVELAVISFCLGLLLLLTAGLFGYHFAVMSTKLHALHERSSIHAQQIEVLKLTIEELRPLKARLEAMERQPPPILTPNPKPHK